MPRTKRKPGRVQVCMDGTAHETQVLYLSNAEAREIATSGVVTEFGATSTDLCLQAKDLWPPQANSPELITLSKACNSGSLSLSLSAVRSARARDPEFPNPVSRSGAARTATALYSLESLKQWESNRV